MNLPVDPPSSFFPGSEVNDYSDDYLDSLPVDSATLNVKPKMSPLASFVVSSAVDIGKLLINQLLQDRATKKTNEYNSPVAQVARLRAAGLNPAAAMGAISGNNNTRFNAAQDNSRISPSELLSLQNLYEQNKMLRAQRKSIEIDNRYKSDTYDNRVKRAALGVLAQDLSNQLQSGRISYQQYANSMKSLENDWLKFISEPNSNYNGFSPREASFYYSNYLSPRETVTGQSYNNDMLQIKRDFANAFGITDSPSNAFDAFFKAVQMLFHYINIRNGGGNW